MAAAAVDFVVTEARPAITPSLERHYEGIRVRIERVAGIPVRSRHYRDAEKFAAAAVILSGSFAPWTRHEAGAFDRLAESLRRFDGAVLGICAGMQLQTTFAGGVIGPRERPAVGFAPVEILDEEGLLEGLGPTAVAYEHHSWDVVALPEGFVALARSPDCAVEALRSRDRPWWGTQFHPEQFSPQHPDGARVLRNFFALAGVGPVVP